MGMHLNYELRLPGHSTVEVAREALRALHQFAQSIPFANVSPLITPDSIESSHRQALLFFAELNAETLADEVPALTGDPNCAMGFLVNPGEGCEPATFGLLKRQDSSGAPVEWYWQCSCKTQYATVVSDAHFLACHTGLTAVLDHAIKLGFAVEVHDEGHYWDTREVSRLLTEVNFMNRLVAGFAGAFSDAVSRHTTTLGNVEAPIFEHPRFERLEMGE